MGREQLGESWEKARRVKLQRRSVLRANGLKVTREELAAKLAAEFVSTLSVDGSILPLEVTPILPLFQYPKL